MAKKLEQLRSGREFVEYGKSHGADVRSGRGSHMIVSTDKGMTPVPVHNGDLGKGLRHAIIKHFIRLGIACLIIGVVINHFI